MSREERRRTKVTRKESGPGTEWNLNCGSVGKKIHGNRRDLFNEKGLGQVGSVKSSLCIPPYERHTSGVRVSK